MIDFNIKRKKWSLRLANAGDEALIMFGEPCIAQLFKKTRVIYIDSSLLEDEDELRETLTHELVHAYIMTYAISHRQFRDEEFICEFIAVYGASIIELTENLIKRLDLK